MPTLPIELIVEILSRLPVKTLLKFRCVSKSWLALIRSPEFVKTHLNVSAKNKDYTHHRLVLTETINLFSSFNIQYILRDCSISSLRNNSGIEASDLNYPMKNQQQSVCVVGSVNGLICLAIKDTDLVLWNPSIRLFKNLPDSGPSVTGDYHFDSCIYGFGYDESNDDYKVVGVLWNRYKLWHPLEVKIYSLKSNSWRSMDDIPDGL
ncbi:F-box/kelch-repeat protein At3g23880-like [Lycium ferocissimum]|uniref:F-box/kelch-repeat protein At3g23880-like n=1 Tax=Lycium ferocissimum TaxID=112874 RepID=UPI002815A1BF|nr:F-box/kelch-repeat protein At3g23880-like [Lycium ferocissimum]